MIESAWVSLAFLALAVFFNVSHNLLLKLSAMAGASWVQKYSFFGAALVLGAVGLYFFSRSLERLQLSLAYPAFSGTSIVLTCVLAVLLFSDVISKPQLAGIALIMLGVSLLGR